MQEALIAADIEVAGGADGVYGNDTMAAVAEYQRRNDGLQETGAVDIATARSLGVYEDPDAVERVHRDDDRAGDDRRPNRRAAAGATQRGQSRPTAPPGAMTVCPSGRSSARRSVVALAAAVARRRRYVVAQRAARRWARVHPATSPRRSVADLRRTGELPMVTVPASPIYDHQLEQHDVRSTPPPG